MDGTKRMIPTEVNTQGGKICLAYSYSLLVRQVNTGIQCRNVNCGRGTQEFNWLSYPPQLSQPVFCYRPKHPAQKQQPAVGGFLPDHNQSRKARKYTLTIQSGGGKASAKAPSSQPTLVCVKLTSQYIHVKKSRWCVFLFGSRPYF